MTLKSVLKMVNETKYNVIDNEEHGFSTIFVDYLGPQKAFTKAREQIERLHSRKVKFITVNTCTHVLEISLV